MRRCGAVLLSAVLLCALMLGLAVAADAVPGTATAGSSRSPSGSTSATLLATRKAKSKKAKSKKAKSKKAKSKKTKKSEKSKKTKTKKKTRARTKPKPRPVTSCPGATYTRGERAYFDGGLVDAMNRLVCSAADRSVVRIKSWFIADDSAVTRRFFTSMAIMHRYHRVQFHIHVGREKREQRDAQYAALVKRVRGIATVAGCNHSCVSSAVDSTSHSKWISVTRLRTGGRPAILQMSANISHKQLAVQHQSGILLVGNGTIQSLFDHEFAVYWACATRGRCGHRAPTGTWRTAGGVSVHFTPTSNDLIAAELDRVRCGRGGVVYASSRVWNDSSVLRRLNQLATTGCTVRIISGAAKGISPRTQPLQPRCRLLHEKYIVIDTPGLREVLSGSKDLSSGKYQVNDNQEMINRSAGVLHAFTARFRSMYGGARTC